mgnify:CR=1 FL=1
MTAYIIDIECNNLLRPALDYSSLPYKLHDWYKLWCVVIRKVGSPETRPTSLILEECTRDNIKAALEGCTELIGHNHIGFDLPVLQLMGLLDYKVGYPNQSSQLFGEDVLLTDTLVWSRLLNPDRFGGHSLGAWGQRLGFPKGDFHDFHEYSQEMLDYWEQDTAVTEKTQEVFGFDFNTDLANKCLEELDNLLQERHDRVSPILPPRRLTKGEQKFYTPPVKQFLKNGKPTAFIEKFVDKIGATVEEVVGEYYIVFEGKKFHLPCTEPVKTSMESDISDLNNLKGYILSLGWVPHEWNERDLGVDSKKRKREPEDVVKAINKYVEDTRESEFRLQRCALLNCSYDRLEAYLLGMYSKGRKLMIPTTPKLRVGVAKDICPNLEKLGKKAEFVKDVVEYFTYKHRRTSIAGGRLDEDDEPLSGFISNTREDGRIPTPAITLGANTGRYRHSIVCNIPRITSLYGGPMRSLFGAGKGFYQLGFDFASLEARIQGHYVVKYEGGIELAESLIAEKPHDLHSANSRKLGITRDDAKAFGYAIMFGAQPKKLARMIGVSESEASRLFSAYWEAVPALAALKANLEKYWEAHGKKFILGLDGRFMMTRSKHSLTNVLFQGGGAVVCKWSVVRIAQELEERGLLGDPFVHTKDDPKMWQMCVMHDEIQYAAHPSLMDVRKYASEEDAELVEETLCSAIGHGSKGVYRGFKTPVVECIDKGIEIACNELKLKVELGFEWSAGANWAQCH